MHSFCYEISFDPGFGAYQSLVQEIKVPFPGFSPSFCNFEGSRAISKPTRNAGMYQTSAETLAEVMFWTQDVQLYCYEYIVFRKDAMM